MKERGKKEKFVLFCLLRFVSGNPASITMHQHEFVMSFHHFYGLNNKEKKTSIGVQNCETVIYLDL